MYYGASGIPACEKAHLHGEIVAFGVLCLLTYDHQFQERDRILAFNRSVGLPVTLAELNLTPEDVSKIVKKASTVVEWRYIPGTPTEERFRQAILETDRVGREAKNKEIKG